MAARSDRILYVDDDEELRLCVEVLLRSAGYRVETAGSADEALVYLRENTYQLVMTDQWMPGASGPEMLRDARRRGLLAGAQTCVFTSDPDAVAPGERVLVKPMSGLALRREVARLLAERPAVRRSRGASVARWVVAVGAGAALMMASLVTFSAVTCPRDLGVLDGG